METGTSLKKKVSWAEQWLYTDVRHKSLYISLHSPQSSDMKWPNSVLSEERERRRLIS